MKKMARCLSLVLAFTLVFGLYTPAMAAEGWHSDWRYWSHNQSAGRVKSSGCLVVACAKVIQESGWAEQGFTPDKLYEYATKHGCIKPGGIWMGNDVLQKYLKEKNALEEYCEVKVLGNKKAAEEALKKLKEGYYVIASDTRKGSLHSVYILREDSLKENQARISNSKSDATPTKFTPLEQYTHSMNLLRCYKIKSPCEHKWETVGGKVGTCANCGVSFNYDATFNTQNAGIYAPAKSVGEAYAKPYSEAGVLEQRGNFSVKGQVTNAYGNVWYVGENGRYYWPADIRKVKELDTCTGTVTGSSNVNINSTNSSGHSVGSIPSGGTMTIYPTKTANNGWLWVSYNGTSGYSSGNLISIQDSDRSSGLAITTQAISFTEGGYPTLTNAITSKKTIYYVNLKLDNASFLMTNPGQNYYNLSEVAGNAKWKSLRAGSHTLKVTAMDAAGSAMTKTISIAVKAPAQNRCAPPTISANDIAGGKRVTITGPASSKITYTNNGVRGTGMSPVSFDLTESAEITASAVAAGMTQSVEVARDIVVDSVNEPEISVTMTPTGAMVILVGDGGEKFYSLDGKNYTRYTSAITLDRSGTVYAYAARTGKQNSEVVSRDIRMSEPNKPVVTLSTQESKIPQNSSVLLSWPAQSNAANYTVKAYRDGTLVEEERETTRTSVAFIAEEPGAYTFEVVANNSFGSSPAAVTRTITAVAPLNVRFVDYDGTILSEQKVNYGAAAAAPKDPERVGHYFRHWNQSFTEVREDMEIEPVYQIITYTVTFKNHLGQTIGRSQSVPYGHAATPPGADELVGPSANYSFVGWSISAEAANSACNLEFVDSNLTAQAVFHWSEPTLPVVIRELAATYDATQPSGRYSVTATVENTNQQYTQAILRIALKTVDEDGVQKMVDTESQTVGLRAGSRNTYTFTMSYPDAASLVEAVVVGYDYDTLTGPAYSEAKSVNVSSVSSYDYGPYSEWTTTDPTNTSGWQMRDGKLYNEEGYQVEVSSKEQYRYRTKSTTTSTSSSLSGWTRDGSVKVEYTAWANQGWSTSNTTNDTRRYTDTRYVVDTPGYTEYVYYHYWAIKDGKTKFSYGNTYWKNYEETRSRTEFPYYKTYDSKYPGYKMTISGMHGSVWWLKSQIAHAEMGHREYYCQTRNAYNVYGYYKWGDWSNWQDSRPAASASLQVDSPRTVFRYRVLNVPKVENSVAGEQDKSGITYTITNETAAMGSNIIYAPVALPSVEEMDLSGKLATVMVYRGKNSDPNESQLQYVGQITIGENNSFTTSFKTKNEPTIDTGDYIIAMSLQGSVGYVNAGLIPAPDEEFTVEYVDEDGTPIGEKQLVRKGENAVAPDAPTKEGKTFVSWSETGTNVHNDLTIVAKYMPTVHAVAFVDWLEPAAFTYALEHGTTLEPIASELSARNVEGYWFVGWDMAPDATVDGNMVISAKYEPEVYTVRFLQEGEQYDEVGNILSNAKVISEQQIEYGQTAQLPTVPDTPEGVVFLGWSTEKEWWNVHEDMDVYPILTYADTVLAPSSNIGDFYVGTDVIIELTVEDGATVYYTTDGSDPSDDSIEYTTPITLTESTQIRAIAIQDGKNDSDIVDVYFEYSEESFSDQTSEDSFVEFGTYNVKAVPGQEVILRLNIEDNPGLMGYLFAVECDKDIFDVDYAEESGFEVTTGVATSNGTTLCVPYKDSGWQVLWFSTQKSDANGNLFELKLKVNEGAAAGVYPVKLSYSPANTVTENAVELRKQAVDVAFNGDELVLLGDVNGDGSVTAVDVIRIARYVINDFTFTATEQSVADVTGDGRVTAADAIRLARYIVGLAELG